ncbi:MAG: hypothetical protein M0C28_48620 [Candidatus Moduliflexus flocculans]|nr:hypothetical protein [Candidatus Moduliflexus flocculans]
MLEPAPFTLSELRLRRPAFNPGNPGALGSAEIRFNVTSFGRAELEIRGPSGVRAAWIPVPPFAESLQSIAWDGRDPSGRPLPDGEYDLVLRAFPEDPGEDPAGFVRTASVRIDSSLLVSPRGLSGGVSGLALFPDPFADPGRLLRFYGSWKPILVPSAGLDRSFVSLGVLASFGPAGEAAVLGSFDPEAGESGSLGAGLKMILARDDPFHAAAFAALSLGSAEGDPSGVPPARLGLSAALGSPRAYGGLSLELEVPSWEDPAPVLCARAGAALAGGRFAAGFSVLSPHPAPGRRLRHGRHGPGGPGGPGLPVPPAPGPRAFPGSRPGRRRPLGPPAGPRTLPDLLTPTPRSPHDRSFPGPLPILRSCKPSALRRTGPSTWPEASIPPERPCF